MTISYRLAEYKDIDTLIDMRMAYLKEDRADLPDEQAVAIINSLKIYFRKIGSICHAVIAECNGRVVGTALLAISEKPANPAFITGRIGTLMNVYTVPEYRRQGIATEMLKMIIGLSKEKSISRLELSATEKGKGLYEKLGFTIRKTAYTDMILNL